MRALLAILALLAGAVGGAAAQPAPPTTFSPENRIAMDDRSTLDARQRAILPIGAFTASGDIPSLERSLVLGLDAGLTVAEIREVLLQLHAYAGFPRSLNALSAFMGVLEQRRARGVQDAPGREPSPLPPPEHMREVGTANQTRLSGAPVTGPLFDFAPAIDDYLKAHLFGAVFARDNLDWPARELATIGALAALPGVESQLRAHLRIGANVGLAPSQLRQAVDVLRAEGDSAAADRVAAAMKPPADAAR